MALAYLPDIESDMSVFHRVDDVRAMPAQTFIDRVLRLPAYSGIMRRLVEAIYAEEHELGTSPSTSNSSAPSRGRDGRQEVIRVAGDRESITQASAFAGLVEFGEDNADGRQGVQAS